MTETSSRPPTSPWNATVPGRDEQRDAKRRALIHQAGSLFRQKGFRESSMDDIAQALGVTKGALYRYVRNKHELLFECHQVAMVLGETALEYGRAHGRNGFEQINATMRFFVENYLSANSAGAALVNIDELEPEHKAEIIAHRDEFDRALRSMIRRGVEDGSIAPLDPRIVAFTIMGAINWLPRWFNPDGALSGAEIVDRMMTFLTSGLKPREAEKRDAAPPQSTPRLSKQRGKSHVGR